MQMRDEHRFDIVSKESGSSEPALDAGTRIHDEKALADNDRGRGSESFSFPQRDRIAMQVGKSCLVEKVRVEDRCAVTPIVNQSARRNLGITAYYLL